MSIGELIFSEYNSISLKRLKMVIMLGDLILKVRCEKEEYEIKQNLEQYNILTMIF